MTTELSTSDSGVGSEADEPCDSPGNEDATGALDVDEAAAAAGMGDGDIDVDVSVPCDSPVNDDATGALDADEAAAAGEGDDDNDDDTAFARFCFCFCPLFSSSSFMMFQSSPNCLHLSLRRAFMKKCSNLLGVNPDSFLSWRFSS